jgi:hypothetical protein
MVAFAPALAIPFAEAVGITITGLSLAAITDKVSQYVNQNPEESKAILKMILPASVTEQGLSTLFKKKAKSPEKEVDSEDIDPQDLSREDKAKIMKEYGKSRGQNKRERMIEIAKQLGLVGEEKEKQKVFDEVEQRYENDEVEENIKPKFDYKRFFKADGGRVNYANGGRGYNNMSITRAQKATQLLNEMAPKGEKLAYINNREAELLKRMGGAGVDINKTGIKSYVNFGSGRGSVAESLSQAAFGSSGPTFSSDGESGSFTPKGNFATITKGGGGGNDQPITEIRPNFNYNIDPFSINPRLNFKNIASIIYLQEFLDKKARGEDVDLEADINFRDQLGNLDIFGNLGRSGNIVGANIPFLQSGIGSLAYSPDIGLAAGLRGNLTEDLSGGVSFQDGQQNVNFNYNKGPFSADFTSGPEENNIQVGFKMPFADGGRIGYVGGGLATTQDFANALKSVSAGTTYQQQIQAKEYARNEASNLLSQAMRSADPNKGPGLQGIYDTFFRTTLSPGIRPKTFTPDSSGRMIMYSARDRDAILDSMANQMLNTTPYADPKASASEAYGKMMQQKTEEAYGTPDKYRAEAMTLGMPVEAYYDYLTTRDDKNIMQQYRKQDPYFDASTYVPFTEADRTSSPYDIYFQQILQQQIDAGVPEEGRIQSGEVALPSMISPTTTGAAPRPFMSYSDALAQTRQSLGLADGGRVNYQAGGVATPEQYAAALQQVGAGSALDKLRSTGDYIKNYVSNVGQSVLNKNPAIRGIASFYGVGKPISSFSDFSSGSQQAIKDAVMRTVQNPTLNQYSKTNIPMSSYTNYFSDKGKANTRGIYDTGYISRSDQFKDMISALGGNEDAIARMTLGRFNVDINPTSGVGYLRDKYDFSKQMPGGKAYDINMQLPQDFVQQILNNPTYQKTTGYTPPTTQTTSSIPQYYQNNPGSYDFDKFKEAYSYASGAQDKVSRTPEGQILVDFGSWDPSRTYQAYKSNTGTSSSRPFFEQFAEGNPFQKNLLVSMYGAPGADKAYYADGGLATMFRKKQ